ncbi:hypothetical protein HU200_052379 [Digitaria exilis]|uniref:Uncharacterized protein n=1 Tax=Digitaria exilis TaxID=1010633 RepID=A0A835AQ38_9POAL|nr:hypothetical protein HU200_052379 [Digitaria exilis]
MAEVGGMLAGGVLKLVAGKVAEATGDRLMLQWRFGEDLEGMKVTAESIQAVLEDAERKSLAETSVQLWLERLTTPRTTSPTCLMSSKSRLRANLLYESAHIQALSVDVCWDIIKQRASFENRFDKERFEVIGKEIAEKCGGVALAARAIGYILRSKSDLHEWVSVKESGIWNVSTSGSSSDDRVLASLKLSYSSFIMPSDGTSIQQHGEAYINQLLDMSFFQHSWTYRKYVTFGEEKGRKDITFFTMHDLVYDLVRSVMGDELLDASEEFSKRGGSSFRYAFLADCSKPLNSYVTSPNKIRALYLLGSGSTEHCSIGFSTARYLRVLDLGASSLKKLPSSIGQLKLLRYLSAPDIEDPVIPSSITKLSKLIYLSLRGSSDISTLPKSFGNMEALMYLDLSGHHKIKKLPKSFGKLASLVHLDFSDCHVLYGIPEALCGLTKLQHLNLSRCDRLFCGSKGLHEVIGELTKLRYLNLSGSLIPMFWFNYCGRPEVLIGCVLDKISTLSNLEHLDLSGGVFDTLPDSFCSLRRLHTLDLTGCNSLKELPKDLGGEGSSLKYLIGCICETIPNNKSLTRLPKFAVHDVEGEQSSNLILLKDAYNPIELEIHCLENVKSTEEARMIKLDAKQSLEALTLSWTRGTNGFVEDMELLRELAPPSSLKRFELHGYNNVRFPTWLRRIALYLPNLVRVQLKGLSMLPPLGELANLKYLNLEDMPNVTKIDRSFCGDTLRKVFPQLEELTISNMENLEEWNTTYSNGEGIAEEFMFPNLKELKTIRCPKLRLKPCPPKVKKTWVIKDSDGVLTQWEEGASHTVCSSSVPLVHTLRVDSCREPMHQWKLLHHLPGLTGLTLGCSYLSSTPEVTRSLASLQSLCLKHCLDSEELSQWLGVLTSLESLSWVDCYNLKTLPEQLGDCVSLRTLNLYSCWNITSFPEGIKKLTSLESLYAYDCPKLREWCELNENKTKIDHIKEVRTLVLCYLLFILVLICTDD